MVLTASFVRLESESVEAHLFHHCQEAVRAGGREVFGKAYVVNEVEFGVEDVVGSLIVKHLDEQRDDSLDDDSVGVGGVVDFSVGRQLGVEPHAARTPR